MKNPNGSQLRARSNLRKCIIVHISVYALMFIVFMHLCAYKCIHDFYIILRSTQMHRGARALVLKEIDGLLVCLGKAYTLVTDNMITGY